MSESILKNKRVMIGVALLCCILWGSAFPAIKISYQQLAVVSPYSKILLAGLRFGLAGIMVLVFAAIKSKKSIIPNKSDWGLILTIAALQTFGAYILYYIGMGNTTAVKGSILITTNIFIVTILSHFFLKNEKLNSNKIIGLIFGFIGIIVANLSLLGGQFVSFSLAGDGFILINCVLVAVATMLIKRKGKNVNMLLLNGWQLFLGGLLLCVVGYAGHPVWPSFNLASSALLVYMAALSAVAFTLWFMLLQNHDASKVVMYKFTVPIFGSTMSILLLPNEYFRVELFIALIFVSIGIIIVNRVVPVTKIKFKKSKDTA